MERAEAITRLKAFEPRLRAMGASALYLFGSTARGQQRPNSDIDVFVDIEPGHRFTLMDMAAAQRLLREGLSVRTDLTTRDSLHPILSQDILAESIQIF